ncbi:ABC transporter ATP-binding protein [Fervidibacillus halotolerans]|uniref:ABC transporter ATP-binding protein n=1 Tax=Fervidibacillus halotolerans TaxID=2980027 RepID=A0A9E8M0R1_9BACI|nr:ABC transporter ATP-binding protein [Fervidibacillus halotolerans]WAA12862.1 ABC transporter ATP-binding protein [Fervidibacillus halotolerans]
MKLLEVNHLSKSFGNQEILKDISFHVEDGEFVSILGPSGSGKSTLFRMIGGITKPSSGSIILRGENIIGKKGHISYIPQSSSLFPWRTVLQNVLLDQELSGKVDKERAVQLIERAGLKGYEHAYPHELSGGMKQRVSFIRSFMNPQSLILLDEPFSALDEFTRLSMHKWLLSIWSENKKSILFVTHNIEEALFLSDRLIIFSEKPANIKAEFTLPFSRPRNTELLLTEPFLQWKRKVFSLLVNE